MYLRGFGRDPPRFAVMSVSDRSPIEYVKPTKEQDEGAL
jgi:hypothetical protein